MEHGGRVEEEDMARFIQQLEGRVGTEVNKNTITSKQRTAQMLCLHMNEEQRLSVGEINHQVSWDKQDHMSKCMWTPYVMAGLNM